LPDLHELKQNAPGNFLSKFEESIDEVGVQERSNSFHEVIFTDSDTGYCSHQTPAINKGNIPINEDHSLLGANILNLRSVVESSIVEENRDIIFKLKVPINSWKYGQICIAPHLHFHAIELSVETINPAHDCDIFVGARFKPSANMWDFKSDSKGKDNIRIPTYLQEMKNSEGTIFFGIFGEEQYYNGKKEKFKSQEDICILKLNIGTIENTELLHKLNLRGGQVLLPRDLNRLKN
jgi:hypothetical protein